MICKETWATSATYGNMIRIPPARLITNGPGLKEAAQQERALSTEQPVSPLPGILREQDLKHGCGGPMIVEISGFTAGQAAPYSEQETTATFGNTTP